MKKLILVRHAEAMIGDIAQTDYFRGVTDVGRAKAKLTARFLSNIKIDKVLVSPAKRTQETLDIILQTNNIPNIEIVDVLYSNSLKAITDILTQQEDTNNLIVIIGHNPTLSSIAYQLVNKDQVEHHEMIFFSCFPNAGAFIIYLPILSWQALDSHQGAVVATFIPQG